MPADHNLALLTLMISQMMPSSAFIGIELFLCCSCTKLYLERAAPFSLATVVLKILGS